MGSVLGVSPLAGLSGGKSEGGYSCVLGRNPKKGTCGGESLDGLPLNWRLAIVIII